MISKKILLDREEIQWKFVQFWQSAVNILEIFCQLKNFLVTRIPRYTIISLSALHTEGMNTVTNAVHNEESKISEYIFIPFFIALKISHANCLWIQDLSLKLAQGVQDLSLSWGLGMGNLSLITKKRPRSHI